jgi:hypothetical protein
MITLGRRHLERVLDEYIEFEHYNTGRARRALALRAPADDPNIIPFPAHHVTRRPVLGGLLNEYNPAAQATETTPEPRRPDQVRGLASYRWIQAQVRPHSRRQVDGIR